jgi:hypothetical protein
MLQHDLFFLFTEPLERLNITYMVTGSVACIVYGEPRMTHDIDLVLKLEESDFDKMMHAFPLDDFYCPPTEVMRIESRRGQNGHFNLIHHESGFKADIYLKSKRPLHQWALDNRRHILFPDGRGLYLAPPEYVVLRKLEFFRQGGSDKHIRDIQGILETMGEPWDF